MRVTGYIVLGILVVLCFGLLVAFKSPAAPEPQSQNQTLVNAINTVNHQIDNATALRLIANLKGSIKTMTSAAASATTARGLIGTRGGVFARRAFDRILAQPGCIGIRLYYAQKDDGSPTVVAMGVNVAGQDMATGELVEEMIPCPPVCN